MQVIGRSEEVAAERYAETVASVLKEKVRLHLARWEETSVSLPPEQEFADLVAEYFPAPAYSSAHAELIGPVYDTSGVREILGGVSRQAVDQQRRQGSILAFRAADAKWLYPTFQFQNGELKAELKSAIRALRNAPDTAASAWFKLPNRDLDDMTPLDWADQGYPMNELTRSAEHAAVAWSQ